MRDESASRRGIRERWNALSTRGRERVILGTLVGASLAARDLVLLGSAAGLFALLELTGHAGRGAAGAQPH